MSYLRNLLGSTFDVDFGLSEEETTSSLAKTRNNPNTRESDGIRSELEILYADDATDWIGLLQNDSYRVYDNCVLPIPQSQQVARNFVTRRIWNVLFPDEPRSTEEL